MARSRYTIDNKFSLNERHVDKFCFDAIVRRQDSTLSSHHVSINYIEATKLRGQWMIRMKYTKISTPAQWHFFQ